MDIYHAYFDLNEGQSDVEFADEMAAFMGHLKAQGNLETWRLTRRKLGLGPSEIGEFHLMMEFKNLSQLDEAFFMASERSGTMEIKHAGINQKVTGIKFALYRDFPDSHRKRGEEKF